MYELITEQLVPARVLHTEENIENAATLLQEKDLQISLKEEQTCVMIGHENRKVRISCIT